MIDIHGKVLVVVDMQPTYRVSMNRRVIAVCEDLIREAVLQEAFIVFLEFSDEPTFKRLRRLVTGHDLFSVEQKDRCDGSSEVIFGFFLRA